MKLYLSADIEGIAGATHWDEAHPEKPDYVDLRDRMTDHVAAACDGAVAAGATEILIKDAHAFGRNLLLDRLPECARVVRGWSGHPFLMVQEIDETFDALAMVGYHARAGSGGNPLAHTLSSSRIARLSINGEAVSEFLLHAWVGTMLDVPTVFVSGDEALCEEVRHHNASIHACPVLRGVGASTVSLHPDVAAARIREGMQAALEDDVASCCLTLPKRFELEIRYKEPAHAYAKGFYPGARQTDDNAVSFETADYFEVLRAIQFLV